MLWTLSIIILMVGCGDVSVPAAPGNLSAPADPEAFELECGEAEDTAEGVFFYAEAQAPEWEFTASTCTETLDPTAPPSCTSTSNYQVEAGVVRVLCGVWGTEERAPLPDFVRIEPLSRE